MLLEVGTVADVTKRKRVVVEHEGTQIVVVAHDGRFFALDNICIHRQRELAKGVVLKDRLVCPGHQWAFDLATGWEAVKGECQPTYDVSVVEGTVLVDTESRRVVPAAQP
jgi:nitrite reductase (NADH) small subunit